MDRTKIKNRLGSMLARLSTLNPNIVEDGSKLAWAAVTLFCPTLVVLSNPEPLLDITS